MRRTFLSIATGLALVAGSIVAGLAIGASSAMATTPAPICKTVVSQIVNHDDGGHHGVWASDSFTRTVKICEVAQGSYKATVTDAGWFTTKAGAFSPREGKPLAGGITGTMTGGFSLTFTAKTAFGDWQGNHPGYSASSSLGTSAWVKAIWGGASFVLAADASDWGWTYATCPALGTKGPVGTWWVDKNPSDGTLPADGDITGAKCPTPSPCPSKSKSASPSASASKVSASPSKSTSKSPDAIASAVTTHSPEGMVPAASTGRLPTTGSRAPLYLGGTALVLLGLGFALLLIRRRRRIHFTA